MGAALVASLVLGIFAVSGRAYAAGNLVLNGSFEQTTGVSGTGGYICTGTAAACGTQSNVNNWFSSCTSSGCGNHGTVASILFGGSGGSAFNGGFGLQTAASNSPDGGNFIGIDGDPTYTAVLGQSVSGLTAGSTYLLTFYMAADVQNGFTANTTSAWQVSLGSSATQTSTVLQSTNGGFSGWTKQSMTFVADAATDVLEFIAKGTPSGAPPVSLLDGVSLTAVASPVPEPAAWALVMAGLVGLTFVKMRRGGRFSS